jgi:hypothetical protein
MTFGSNKKVLRDRGLGRLIYEDSTREELAELINSLYKVRDILPLPDLAWTTSQHYGSLGAHKSLLYLQLMKVISPVAPHAYVHEQGIKNIIDASFNGASLDLEALDMNYQRFMRDTYFPP